MLVLTRRVDEGTQLKVPGLDQEIEVTVLRIHGSSVRLGFMAPPCVAILRAELVNSRAPPVSLAPRGEKIMQTVKRGDRVQVHYVKRFQDGSVASSRDRAPLELTVGVFHPRLPGLGLALVGLAPGTSTTVSVPPEHAYGLPDPGRVRHWARTRFPNDQPLPVGKWVRLPSRKGKRRPIQILEVSGQKVLVDTNHPWAGQTMELEVEVVAILDAAAGPDLRISEP
jgi:carbon storage regulator CsrA